MLLGNKDLQWVTSFKYLGINFLSGLALKINTCHIKRTFYKACNGILSHCSTADVFVKLSLVKAYCLPVLTYCIGALNLPVVQIRNFNVCWNDWFRKLFGYKRFKSVKEVLYFCGKISFDLIYELQRWKFLSAAHKLRDRFSCLYYLQSHTVSELKLIFGDTDFIGRMKQLVHVYFGHLFE